MRGAIAADAGVSKMTVYSNFGSKEGLFQAVVRERTETVVGAEPASSGGPVPVNVLGFWPHPRLVDA